MYSRNTPLYLPPRQVLHPQPWKTTDSHLIYFSGAVLTDMAHVYTVYTLPAADFLELPAVSNFCLQHYKGWDTGIACPASPLSLQQLPLSLIPPTKPLLVLWLKEACPNCLMPVSFMAINSTGVSTKKTYKCNNKNQTIQKRNKSINQ